MGEDSDKTEDPSEHKLQEGKKKGEVFKSQDIIQTTMLAVTCAVVYAERGWILASTRDFMLWCFSLVDGDINLAERSLLKDGLVVVATYFKVLAPLFMVGFVVAVIINLAQVQFIFTFETMKPKLSKLNPIQGFKRIVSIKSLVELAKQVAKLGVVTWVCIKVIKNQIMSLQNAVYWTIPQTVDLVRKLAVKLVSYTLVAMVVISILDYIYQKKQFLKQMKMSIKELRDEYKETEGNPQVKGKIRQLMRQGAQQRMMENVPNSTAVVTNPTHIAVALRYVPGQDPAPIVVAKGKRDIAVNIKVLAEDNDVPILENVELARALFTACEIGAVIPVELYKATAEVLAYVFRLKKKREMMRKRRFMQGRSRAFMNR